MPIPVVVPPRKWP